MTTITQPDKQEQGPLQVRLPMQLIRKLRIHAVTKDVHPRDVVIEALEALFEEHPSAKRQAS